MNGVGPPGAMFSLDALIVVDVAGEDQVGDAAGIANGVLESVGHFGAAAVKDVEGIDRMVEGEDKRQVIWARWRIRW